MCNRWNVKRLPFHQAVARASPPAVHGSGRSLVACRSSPLTRLPARPWHADGDQWFVEIIVCKSSRTQKCPRWCSCDVVGRRVPVVPARHWVQTSFKNGYQTLKRLHLDKILILSKIIHSKKYNNATNNWKSPNQVHETVKTRESRGKRLKRTLPIDQSKESTCAMATTGHGFTFTQKNVCV